jgi:dihydrofolate reductase
MGRLVVSMNVSLDGYIEAQGQDDGTWLRIDEEVHHVFNELAARADAFLYGRKVYEVMIPYWPDAAEDPAKPAYERDYGRLWVEKPKVVVSSSLTEPAWNTRVVAAGVLEEVAHLKRETKGYLLCYGGAQLVTALQEHNLVDEYALFVHPAALGAGVPFFRRTVGLKLLDVRRFELGALGLRYSSVSDVSTP